MVCAGAQLAGQETSVKQLSVREIVIKESVQLLGFADARLVGQDPDVTNRYAFLYAAMVGFALATTSVNVRVDMEAGSALTIIRRTTGALENVKMAGHVLERINASALQIGEVHVVTNLCRFAREVV